MWIVLLDHSDSMSEPFEADVTMRELDRALWQYAKVKPVKA